MDSMANQVENPLSFIKECVHGHRVLWTYHINMRLNERDISRRAVFESTEYYEIIESYPDDKYLPSYLIWTRHQDEVFHILFAIDANNTNVRIITAYRPDPNKWEDGLKRRKNP